MEIFKNTNFDFLGKKWPFIIASLLLTLAGIVSLIVKGGPRYGIDFRGGVLMYVRFNSEPPENKIRQALQAKIPGEVIIQRISGTNEVIVSTELSQDERAQSENRQKMQDIFAATFGQQNGKRDFHNSSAEDLMNILRAAPTGLTGPQLQEVVQTILDYRNKPPRSGLIGSFDELSPLPGVLPVIVNTLKEQTYLSPFAIRNIEVVGPKVGKELQTKALNATLLALGGMLIYIAFRFEWMYGVAAVIAVLHDTIITIGIFSLANKEISLTVIAALLTLVGYSMNDTIVVFDRIRENLRGIRTKSDFDSLVNASINQTLSRTVLTSGLTFLTALALWIFGGEVLNGFSFALVVGIIVGTFSSVFIASPILIFLRDWSENRKKAQTPAAAASRTSQTEAAAGGKKLAGGRTK
ncbi:MAG: protein translocase subunit SecF [Acidobacteria bacterium]|nr:protein translocase subunit SecF [Acidobacteriota bacterium]